MKTKWLHTEDEQLIKDCLEGSSHAQEKLYKKYITAVFNRIQRMVANRTLAEDLSQEVFIKVFQQLKQFNGTSTLGAWIKRISINTALNHIRKTKRVRFEELDGNETTENESYENPPNISMEQIHYAIKKLPEGSRIVLNLYLLEGYQHKEIAQILDISESTSKTQYRRGKIMLQQSLKNLSEIN